VALPSVVRLVRTISHLTPRQIAYQLLRRLEPKRRVSVPVDISPRPGLCLTPPLPRDCGGEPWAFTFIGERKSFDPTRFDWASMDHGKLWRYNLHYFDYLHEPQRSNGPELIESWIASNPQGRADAWEPFPVSLRLVNWIKFFLSSAAPSPPPASWLESLALQARWLSKNIEYHLLANHYFKNAKALVFAGVYFDGVEARRWLDRGLGILRKELPEQVLSDGGHFERSPMYHCMILEDCLDLWNLCRSSGLGELTELTRELERVLPAMLRFAEGLTHPDGGIALFNDAALGIEPGHAELAAYFAALGGEQRGQADARVRSFTDSGYFRISPCPGDVLLADCGPIGPDYQPGHAHCDTLSFELSLNGRRIIVDSGCCQYPDGAIRQYNRGSAGHNGLSIDGENQSEVWGAHRVARRARPLYAMAADEGGALVFEGAHDGYTRLAGKPVHHRRIAWADGRIEIWDRVMGLGEHDLELRLHVHPDCAVRAEDDAVILDSGAAVLRVASRQGRLEVERGWYCPKFAEKRDCAVLCVRVRAALPWQGGFVMTKEKG
jgi:uncharacterized heparinase superfamily protein